MFVCIFTHTSDVGLFVFRIDKFYSEYYKFDLAMGLVTGMLSRKKSELKIDEITLKQGLSVATHTRAWKKSITLLDRYIESGNECKTSHIESVVSILEV